jgi:hypothetical protein
MPKANGLCRGPFAVVTLFAASIFGQPMHSQDTPPPVRVGGVEITGIPEDWSHHHVVFSNPGTEQQAVESGRYEQWLKIVNEPRYVMQQLKRNAPVQGPAAADAEYRSQWISKASAGFTLEDDDNGLMAVSRNGQTKVKKDWSETLVGPGLAAGQYPAKYSLSVKTASCSDYVVFPTGISGSATQATIVAFNNLYTGGCTDSPSVYWAYNTGTGAIANTSPTLSQDGTQLAFMQVSSSVASLVILKMASSGGTVSAPATITSVAASSYRSCTAPCYTAITLSGSPNDTSSAPFYIYSSADTLYVGDNSGKVHQFTGVFQGTPAEVTANGWPATVSTETSPALNSPIYDSVSGNIFVGDSGGYLHQFAASTPGTVNTSNRLENNTVGVFDPPIVDSTSEEVYAFVGYSGDTSAPANSSYMNKFAAASSIAASWGTGLDFENGGSTNPSTSIMRAGTFDDQYYASSEASGNLYVCENGVLYQVPMPAFSAANTYNTAVSTVGVAATCSPVTEFLGVTAQTTLSAAITTTTGTSVSITSATGITAGNYIQVDSEIMDITAISGTTLTVTRGQLGTTAATHNNGETVQEIKDWLFLSVEAKGNAKNSGGTTLCTGACLYNYSVLDAGTTGTGTAGLTAAGGTSGIIVDNQSTTEAGAEQIYYNTLTGDNAVQASQANP